MQELRALEADLALAEEECAVAQKKRDDARMGPPDEADPDFPHYAFSSALTREMAEAMVDGQPDGTFLLRQKEEEGGPPW